MSKGSVFWLDEEENAAYPEMIQLRFHNFAIEYMTEVDKALDRMLSDAFIASNYKAFILDAHMPTFGDVRFQESSPIDRSLAGVRLCDILSRDHKEIWEQISKRTLIYTMLPHSPRVEAIRRFANRHGVIFIHKTDDGQIYERLTELGWL